MIRISKQLILIGLMGLICGPLFAQEAVIKKYAEDRSERALCFYPSTLRMINLSKNPEFNELVKPIEKMLIFILDSTARADKKYRKLPEQFEKNGFEEYVTMYGAGNNMFIYGKEDSAEMIGVMGMNERVFAFYLRGNINWQKIPKLMTTMQDNEILQLLDLKR